ncbi:hypothetical protein AAFF_G00069150 [Aldrovandia affinis]|uniref:Uncharacterized protein n=1 Tax=Aldrovandia affinis TaxID=143900 RepID=A0AAD7WDD4_9TELE|nr:hypothetical protein AAFF_G00069150 [Aldrovandia affinis]
MLCAIDDPFPKRKLGDGKLYDLHHDMQMSYTRALARQPAGNVISTQVIIRRFSAPVGTAGSKTHMRQCLASEQTNDLGTPRSDIVV